MYWVILKKMTKFEFLCISILFLFFVVSKKEKKFGKIYPFYNHPIQQYTYKYEIRTCSKIFPQLSPPHENTKDTK